jgi:hypothetical protein
LAKLIRVSANKCPTSKDDFLEEFEIDGRERLLPNRDIRFRRGSAGASPWAGKFLKVLRLPLLRV